MASLPAMLVLTGASCSRKSTLRWALNELSIPGVMRVECDALYDLDDAVRADPENAQDAYWSIDRFDALCSIPLSDCAGGVCAKMSAKQRSAGAGLGQSAEGELCAAQHSGCAAIRRPSRAGNRTYHQDMATARFVYWQDGAHWLGYFDEFPEYLIQGESLEELQEHLKDLYRDLTSGDIPGIRRTAELSLS